MLGADFLVSLYFWGGDGSIGMKEAGGFVAWDDTVASPPLQNNPPRELPVVLQPDPSGSHISKDLPPLRQFDEVEGNDIEFEVLKQDGQKADDAEVPVHLSDGMFILSCRLAQEL